MCPHCRSHRGCIHCRTDGEKLSAREILGLADLDAARRRRELGLVCGRLYSPAWLIARAKRHAQRVGDVFDAPAPKRAQPLTQSVLPAGFTLA